MPADLRGYIEVLARGQRAPHRLVRRAQILERASRGMSTYAIAREVGCCETTVRKWRARLGSDPRGPALEDAPRSGRPARIGLDVRLAVLRLGCDVPPEGERKRRFREVWTMRSLRDAVARETSVRISVSEVHSILRCGGLSPHRVVGWLHSPDPEFAERSRRIAGLYVAPPKGTHVISIDEKTGIQATRRIHPNHVDAQGRVRREFEYQRRGTTTMIAALDVATGCVRAVCKRRTRDNFIRFLDAVLADYPEGNVCFVLDNLNIHKGPAIEAWAATYGKRVQFVYTPKHASWVNQIEIWFSILQRRVLRYGCFASVRDLEQRLCGFVRYYNRFEAKPFRWRFRGELRRPVVRADRLVAMAA